MTCKKTHETYNNNLVKTKSFKKHEEKRVTNIPAISVD